MPDSFLHERSDFKALVATVHNRRREHPQAIRSGVFKDSSTLLSRPDSIRHNSRPYPARPRSSLALAFRIF